MKRRHITPRLLAALRDTPVVFVQGPRQAGKTTLVQSLKDDGHDAAYFTFDDAAVLAAAQGDADSFVANLPQKVVLDEVQRRTAAGRGAAYSTFEDAPVLAAAQGDADSFVANLPQKVVLDEVQRVPDVLRAIKRSVDTRRQPGRFLLDRKSTR